ncbi:MAG: type IV pilus twitching motility protein PilT [Armatimonadota bacterium]|nr:type IV pilus twitching motility protein PilT [Armatimonadota bacterium]MDR5703241.1 type IV pilus twitching motility protein PilT [Armatimonadota bacterium]MDR7433827.1 type IV pilus twitching motility protein PilT [Armatimonadota bacterium]
MDITELLLLVKERNASDLHLTVGAPPILRIDGKLTKLDHPPLTREQIHAMLYEVLTDDQKAKFEETHDLDFSLDLAQVARFRVNLFMTRLGEAAAFRLIPSRIKSLEELGLPPVLAELAMKDRGLILITGPTGSGKTTTLAAIIDYMNDHRYDHIITIEDPIEFVHQHRNCLINQREVGPHTRSFANALRAALREDPDVILVGEMRDLETISLALTAAETGHLVLATLHTNSAAQTINRIIDVFPPHQQEQVRVQLSETILGVCAQTLIPRADGFGRVVAVEMMVATPAIRNLIREAKTYQIPSIIQTSTKDGMQSLDQSLRNLLRAGLITLEEAIKRAVDKQAFMTGGNSR